MQLTAISRFLLAFTLAASGLGTAAAAQPAFSKSFSPSTIGPGAVSTLTFTIANGSATPVTDLDFTDNLPAGVTVADSSAATTCSVGTLTAEKDGGAIAYTAGQLEGGSTCTVTVNVTAATAGAYPNTSGDLTSSAGNSGPAAATLTVDTARPGFAKSFPPGSAPIGSTSTLTFTIDNTANTSGISSISFSDTFPAGMEIANPANAATTCTGGTLTAPAGGSTFSYGPAFGGDASLAAGATCTVSVAVKATATGAHLNQSGDLTSVVGFATVNSGSASATLDVTGAPAGSVLITKDFTDDPVVPGGAATLVFTLTNTNRDFAATDVAFTDDLAAMLAGSSFDGEISNDCGGTVSGVGTDTIGFSGGSLPGGGTGSCTIVTSVGVAGGAGAGSYANTTSVVTAMIDGANVPGNAATDNLSVISALPPIFSKSFTDDPVDPGNNATLVYTIENPNPLAGFTDIAFQENLAGIVSSARLVASSNTCGATVTETTIFAPFLYRMDVSGGSLAAASTCTITATVSIPAATASPNSYPSTSEELTATGGGISLSGGTAFDTLQVGGSPAQPLSLLKNFADAAVIEGGAVDLIFTLGSSGDVPITEIAFIDDLNAFYAGTTVSSVVSNGCNGTVTGIGTSNFAYSGGSLSGVGNCTIQLSLAMGTAGAATPLNTTSELTANINGAGAAVLAGTEATASITVNGADSAPLTLAKEFLTDPVLPGNTTTLRFTIDNPNTTTAGVITLFTDNLAANLAGLAATGAPTLNSCGGTLSGTTSLTYTGGSVPAGTSCTMEVPVLVPVSAASGVYRNTTSLLSSDVAGAKTSPAATDTLEVVAEPLTISKSFTNNPVQVGTQATLTFTVENLFGTAATDVQFTDDFDAMLTGATFGGGVSNTCGMSPSLVGAGTFDSGPFPLAANSSCQISVNVNVPASAGDASYPNTTSGLAGTIGSFTMPAGVTASDTLVTTTVAPPSATFTKSFTPAIVVQGFTTTLEFTLTNTGATAASGLRFSDDLDAMLAGATATGLPTAPCGAGSVLAGTGLLTLSNAELAPAGSAGDSCTFSVTVDIPAAAALGATTNTTSPLTDGASTLAAPATAGLTVVEPTANLSIAVSDATDPILPGASQTYTVQINNAGPQDAPNVVGNFILPGDVTLVSTAGCAEDPNGAPTCSLGTIPAGGNASYTVTGTVSNTAVGTLTANASVASSVTDPVPANNATSENTAVIAVADLSVTKSDGIISVIAGETLTYTIAVANAGPATDPAASLSDTMPAATTCTYTSVAAGGATGNTAAGTGDLAETLSLPAGSSVTYSALCTVDPSATGTLSNTATIAASVIDPDGGNDSATDDDTAITQSADLSIAKTDSLTSVAAGGPLTYVIVAGNAGPSDDTAVSVSDTFPADLTCSYTSVAAGGATGNTASGVGDLAETLSLPAGASVTYTAACTVSTLASGTLANTASITGSATDPVPGNNTATDNDTVVMEAVLGFAKSFSPATIEQGQNTTLTFTIDNSANVVAATGMTFSDDFNDPAVSGLVVAAPLTVSNGCGGTFTASPGDTAVDLAAGTVATGAICTIEVQLRALNSGTIVNTTSTLTSNMPEAAQASDTLTVNAAVAPLFSKAFALDTINQGETSVLTFTIDNTANSIEADALTFTDTFPAGMVVASAPGVTNTCGGTFTANAADGSVSLSGGNVAELASCTISVTVQALLAGALPNDAGTVTSTLPESGNATATLTANALPLDLAMVFAPATIPQGQVSTVTFAMRNTAVIAASSIAFSDTLPANVVIAPTPAATTSCGGGTLTAPAGGGTISYSGGGLPAGAGCTITVDVTSSVVGSYPDTTESLTSSLGTSTAASATLTVEAPTGGFVTFVQESDTDGTYGFSSAEPLFTFLMEVNGGTGSQGPVAAPAGSYAITAAPPAGVALTGIACDDADSTGDAGSGILMLNLAAAETVVCTFTAQSSTQKTVDTINRFLTRRADFILSSEPGMGRRIDRLNQGFGNSSPLTFSTGDLKAMLPFTAEVARGSGSYRFATSLVQARQAAASVALAHGSTKNAAYVENYRFDAWFEAQYKKFDTGTEGEGHFAIAYIGADYLVTPDVLVGALLQIDTMEDASAALSTSASGTGWMAGPYMTARLAPNLFFDARVAAGSSRNRVSPFNTYTDNFRTQRWLAVASLTGEFDKGPWTIRPNASLSYFEETQDGYVDSVGATIPSQTVQLGQLQIGPTFTGRFTGDNGQFYAPYFSIDAIYNLGQTSGVTISDPSTPSTEGWRGRLKAGVNMTTQTGATIGFGGTYDGIGRSDFEAWGLSFDLTVPMQKAKAR